MKYSDHYKLSIYLGKIYGINKLNYKIPFILGNILPDFNKLTYLHGYNPIINSIKANKENYLLTLNQKRKLMIAGHTIEGSKRYLSNNISELLKRKKTKKYKWSIKDWYRFGTVVHYIADCFTYPHTLVFNEGFSKHVIYEEILHNNFNTALKQFDRTTLKRINNILIIPDKTFDYKTKKQVNSSDKKIDNNINNKTIDEYYQKLYRKYRNAAPGIRTDCKYIIISTMSICSMMLHNKINLFFFS